MTQNSSACGRIEEPHYDKTQPSTQSTNQLQTVQGQSATLMGSTAADTQATDVDNSIEEIEQPDRPPLSFGVRRRALAVINDPSIDSATKAFIRYALGINDPWTLKLVKRAEAGEIFGDDFSPTTPESSQHPADDLSIEHDATEIHSALTDQIEYQVDEIDSLDEKIEALTDLICRPGNEPDIKSGALLVLMATVEQSPHLSNTAKNLAFLRCCEMNLHDMVNRQIALIEQNLCA